MSHLTILFCSSRDPISWAIRELTWSDWSHVGILEPNGKYVVEARYSEVRRVPLAVFLADNDVVQPKQYRCDDLQSAIGFAWEQVGKPYDVKALFGFIEHRDIASPDKWFCSELGIATLNAGGPVRVDLDAVSRYTPQMLWMLAGDVLPRLKGQLS